MKYLIAVVSVLFLATAVHAEPTTLEVSVLAHGAKFIGDRSGGANIVISDASTGEVLAEGVTRGSTGNTDVIMREKLLTWQNLLVDGAASFIAELDIDTPVQVAITASGPLQATSTPSRASITTWLIPGEHRKADHRVVLELSGYIVEVVENSITADGKGDIIVDINMLCGCPVIPGGLWNADLIDKTAILRNGQVNETVSLEYTGEGTLYRASFGGKVDAPEDVEFRISGREDANSTVRHHVLN